MTKTVILTLISTVAELKSKTKNKPRTGLVPNTSLSTSLDEPQMGVYKWITGKKLSNYRPWGNDLKPYYLKYILPSWNAESCKPRPSWPDTTRERKHDGVLNMLLKQRSNCIQQKRLVRFSAHWVGGISPNRLKAIWERILVSGAVHLSFYEALKRNFRTKTHKRLPKHTKSSENSPKPLHSRPSKCTYCQKYKAACHLGLCGWLVSVAVAMPNICFSYRATGSRSNQRSVMEVKTFSNKPSLIKLKWHILAALQIYVCVYMEQRWRNYRTCCKKQWSNNKKMEKVVK